MRSSNAVALILLLIWTASSLLAVAEDPGGQLIEAVKSGDVENTRSLLEKGAGSDGIDEEHLSPLFWASAAGNLEVVDLLLLAGADVNRKVRFGSTALIAAASWGHVAVIKRLIAAGADVNAVNDRLISALGIAAQRGKPDAVKILLLNGATAGPAVEGGPVPLVTASNYGRTEVVRLLLENGADIQARDEDGRTALMAASYRGRPDTVKLLLEMGAETDLQDSYGNTALILAATTGQEQIIRMLLGQGANPHVKNNSGDNALTVARKRGRTDVVRLLLDRFNEADSGETRFQGSAEQYVEGKKEPIQRPYKPPIATPDVVVSGHPEKIAQIVGEFDRERKCLTENRTLTRYGLAGTDLGVPFSHNGRTYLLFGDTLGINGGDCIAYTPDMNLEDGVQLNFIADERGRYKTVEIPGIGQGDMEVPIEGVSVNGRMYTYHTTDFSTKAVVGRSVAAVSRDDGRTFTNLYDLSMKRFLNVTVVKIDPGRWKGLPDAGGPAILLFGSGEWRKSNVSLAFQPASDIESSGAIRYFAGLDESGKPTWSRDETAAVPLFHQSCVGELSASYLECLDRWILLYNCDEKGNGIIMRTAKAPWGPWSEPQWLIGPGIKGVLRQFMHRTWKTEQSDILHEPGREYMHGFVYGPYIFEDFTVGNNEAATVYFTLSTWNPYTVVLMKARLKKVEP